MCNVQKLHTELRFLYFISVLLLHYLYYTYTSTYITIFACMKRTAM